jgi:GNAT superfamily N-acetyltransferase
MVDRAPDRRRAWTLRHGRPVDAAAMARINVEGFDRYRAFAPPGWEPPSFHKERAWLGERLGDPEVWCLLGEEAGAPVGHVAFMPVALARRALAEPGLAHLWLLFVRPSHWGSGLAVDLHERMLEEATVRGFSSIRLFTPAEQARARRFYEREGWELASEPFHDPDFGLALVEYRRGLT